MPSTTTAYELLAMCQKPTTTYELLAMCQKPTTSMNYWPCAKNRLPSMNYWPCAKHRLPSMKNLSPKSLCCEDVKFIISKLAYFVLTARNDLTYRFTITTTLNLTMSTTDQSPAPETRRILVSPRWGRYITVPTYSRAHRVHPYARPSWTPPRQTAAARQTAPTPSASTLQTAAARQTAPTPSASTLQTAAARQTAPTPSASTLQTAAARQTVSASYLLPVCLDVLFGCCFQPSCCSSCSTSQCSPSCLTCCRN